MQRHLDKKKSTNVSNGCVTSIFPRFWSENGGSSTFFPNVGVHVFNVTMTSPQHEQGSLLITLLA
jgi:hypothetical protein